MFRRGNTDSVGGKRGTRQWCFAVRIPGEWCGGGDVRMHGLVNIHPAIRSVRIIEIERTKFGKKRMLRRQR